MPKKTKKQPPPPDPNRQIGPFMHYKPTRDDIPLTPGADIKPSGRDLEAENQRRIAEMSKEGWEYSAVYDEASGAKLEVMQLGSLRMVLAIEPRQPLRAFLFGAPEPPPPPEPGTRQRLNDRGVWEKIEYNENDPEEDDEEE